MRKPGDFCAVKSCMTRNNGQMSFFRFPKDLNRCKEWLKLCSREDITMSNDVNYCYNNLRVCAKHFENSMFLNDLRNRLQPHAKPMLYIANIVSNVLINERMNPSLLAPLQLL
ncbi:hypothetical protein RI129_003110 [Pyrocoelia pectoralis]|uniref:THAP-type domain-containing protein n=1 Tax=Pyrocoelia pectoralis TaxID=417401 RepID=A0AAN7ZUL4_9COLE